LPPQLLANTGDVAVRWTEEKVWTLVPAPEAGAEAVSAGRARTRAHTGVRALLTRQARA
jgi:hypothetical protein